MRIPPIHTAEMLRIKPYRFMPSPQPNDDRTGYKVVTIAPDDDALSLVTVTMDADREFVRETDTVRFMVPHEDAQKVGKYLTTHPVFAIEEVGTGIAKEKQAAKIAKEKEETQNEKPSD